MKTPICLAALIALVIGIVTPGCDGGGSKPSTSDSSWSVLGPVGLGPGGGTGSFSTTPIDGSPIDSSLLPITPSSFTGTLVIPCLQGAPLVYTLSGTMTLIATIPVTTTAPTLIVPSKGVLSLSAGGWTFTDTTNVTDCTTITTPATGGTVSMLFYILCTEAGMTFIRVYEFTGTMTLVT